jgi:hypothetical protein
MSVFEFLSVAVSFVLGLAVTLVLSSLLAAFRNRRRTSMDWMPFVWAAYVLVYQFQYWWAMWELEALSHWTVATFGLVLAIAAVLFLAGGLVLPSGSADYPDDLRTYFDEDGKWGVGALALYGIVAILGNVTLFGSKLLSPLHYLLMGETACALAVLMGRDRRLRIAATVMFGVLTCFSVIRATTFSY